MLPCLVNIPLSDPLLEALLRSLSSSRSFFISSLPNQFENPTVFVSDHSINIFFINLAILNPAHSSLYFILFLIIRVLFFRCSFTFSKRCIWGISPHRVSQAHHEVHVFPVGTITLIAKAQCSAQESDRVWLEPQRWWCVPTHMCIWCCGGQPKIA